MRLYRRCEAVIFRLRRTVPFLARRSPQGETMSMRKIDLCRTGLRSALCACLCLALWTRSEAFTQVTISTAAPAGIEKTFLAATTAQFDGTVIPNPLASNTYSLILYGPNANYNAPEPPPSNLEEALSLGATVYIYGFANGMTYQQTQEIGTVGFLGNLCGAATNYDLVETSTKTFDRNTCQDVVATIENQLFELSLSTPTPLPPEP